MKRFLIATLMFSSSLLHAQVDMMKYLRPQSYFSSLMAGFEKLDFKWTLADTLQIEMNEGINALDEKNFELAVDHFTKVLKADSLFGPARYYRGVSFKMYQRFVEAERDFRVVTKIIPDAPQPYLELGDLYLMTRNGQKAAKSYQRANKLAPTSIVGQFKMGILSLYEGSKPKAIGYFENCNKLRPDYPDAFLAIGVVKFMDEETKPNSFGYFARAIQADSLFTMGYFWRGVVSASQEKFDLAEQDWTHAIRLNPSNLLLYQFRALLYVELNRFEDAFADFKKMMNASAVDEDEARFRGTSLDHKIGIQNFSTYLVKTGYGLKDETFANLKKGFCLLLIDKYKESIDATNTAQKLDPTACGLYLKALGFQFNKKHDSAFYYFKKTAEIDPEIFDVHKNLAIYHTELKNWKGAMTHLSKMRQLQPRSQVTWRLSGLIKAQLKDYYGAIIDLTRYLKYDTTDEAVLHNRAVVRYQIDDFKGAIDDYQKLKQLRNDIAFDIEISDCFFLLKDTASAIEVLRSALAKDPRNNTLKLELADKLAEAHRVDEARRLLKQVDIYYNRFSPLPNYVSCHLYFVEGKIAKASSELSDLIQKHGECDSCLLLRAKIYLKEDKAELAKKDLIKLKAMHFKKADPLIAKYGL
ncbi:MAG TPA: tetratricopeptide repeat protein [Cyclobacteriaceae bacterium]|jgi:tetratricopeptide (TPR) repeat protein|nr:tetratricopeptide repeat protein [Cyclobacteriaceae bacterium]